MTVLGKTAVFKLARRLLSSRQAYVWPKIAEDTQLFSKSLEDPPAKSRMVILFTPRSGSSRLCGILTDTQKAGQPGEVFNPALIPKVAKRYAATSLNGYIRALLSSRVSGGIFSCKLTYWHLYQVFGSPANFILQVQPTHWVWLLRRDIVAQAISMSRMHQTGFAHSTTADARQDQDGQDDLFHYDAFGIARMILSILFLERFSEALIRRHSLEPLRLNYEELSQRTAGEIAEKLTKHLGTQLDNSQPILANHKKINSQKTELFKQRFNSDHALFMGVIDALRRRYIGTQSDDHND